MKNIYFTVLIIIAAAFSNTYSQTISGSSFYSGRNDTLLFDGADRTSVHETREVCLMKVLLVNGNIYGKVVKKEIGYACGPEPETLITYEKRLLKEGDMVVAGEPITTERDKDFVIAQLGEGENMVLGGESGLVGVKDYCRFPPNVYMTLEAGKLGIDWNPVLPKTVTVCSGDACLRVKGTKFSLEVVKEGGVATSILQVYEGSVTFGRNMDSDANKKNTQSKAEQMKKLTDDFQNGKISIEEYTRKMQEINSGLGESLQADEITVNAGFETRLTGTEKPTDPVPIDEKQWWPEIK